MTGEQNETCSGRASQTIIDKSNVRKGNKKNQAFIKNVIRCCCFASKKENRESKNRKDIDNNNKLSIMLGYFGNKKKDHTDVDSDGAILRNDSSVWDTSDEETDVGSVLYFTDTEERYEIESDDSLVMDHKIEFITSAHGISDTDGFDESDFLSWKNGYPTISVESENALFPILIPWADTERGMIKDHRPFRMWDIHWSCKNNGMQIEQALSLWMQYIKFLNPKVTNLTHLGLGSDDDIRNTANLFKVAMLKYLKKCDISFQTEYLEKSKPGENTPRSPDFMLTSPMNLITFQPTNEDFVVTERGKINWIETRMLYGASTIPDGTSNDIGTILPTAKKYIKNYGPGAFVFAYGCGSELRGQLRDLGISVLDSHPLDLREMEKYQKRWCVDKNGVILP